jgi:SAM-dependent methyltransferase
MFWKTARATYSHVTADDPDVRRFLELSNVFQQDVYGGLAGWIQDAGHRWIAARTPSGRVLEIGFGAGRHRLFFRGDPDQYFVSEYSAVHARSDAWRAMNGRCVRCDARAIPFADGTFDGVVSIYNLEHIEELSRVFGEIHRVLKPGGIFLVALPCEGGLAWNLGRELTTRRFFQRKYGIDYDKVIAFEHVHCYMEIVEAFTRSPWFSISEHSLLPLRLPSVNLNLVGCLRLRRRTATPAA